MKTPRLCHKCEKPVSKSSKTGYCRRCFAGLLSSDPHHHAKMIAAQRRLFATDPAWRARKAEQVRKNCHTPEIRAIRSECAKRVLMQPEVRARNLAAIKAVRMAHVPEPMWDFYFYLTKKKRFRAAEATQLALEEYRRIDPEAAAAFEGSNVVPMGPVYTGWRATVAHVAEAFGLTFDDVLSDSRIAPRPDARAVCAMIFIERGASLSKAAQRLGYNDHSTVVHMRDSWAKRCAKRPFVGEVYARFCAERLAA